MIPKTLAKRIDRAAGAAHRFHRWAHHPLCSRYASEVVAVGHRMRLCRGCTWALTGLLAGVTLGLWIPASSGSWLLLPAFFSLGVFWLRVPKWLSRGAPGLVLGVLATHGWGILITLASMAGLLAWYRKEGTNRTPCARCPERTLAVCSGYLPIVRRERAFRRLTQRWLDLALYAEPGSMLRTKIERLISSMEKRILKPETSQQ